MPIIRFLYCYSSRLPIRHFLLTRLLWSDQRDVSSPEPFDDVGLGGADTSPVRNFDDEVLSEGDPLSLSQFDDAEEEDGEELFGDNLERWVVRRERLRPYAKVERSLLLYTETTVRYRLWTAMTAKYWTKTITMQWARAQGPPPKENYKDATEKKEPVEG